MISEKSTILAIKPPDRIVDLLDEYVSDDIRELGLHMTIADLGDLKEEDVARCISLLHEEMSVLSSINISYVGEGTFKMPNSNFANVVLLSGQGLDVWRYEISQKLKEEGLLNNEIDAFHPHMTIGRSEEKNYKLPETFGFKAFTIDCIYFFRGKNIRIPIFAGEQTTAAKETEANK